MTEALARRRRVAWVNARPEGWFEEMYWSGFPYGKMTLELFSKENFDFICQLVGPYVLRRNTRLRKAIQKKGFERKKHSNE